MFRKLTEAMDAHASATRAQSRATEAHTAVMREMVKIVAPQDEEAPASKADAPASAAKAGGTKRAHDDADSEPEPAKKSKSATEKKPKKKKEFKLRTFSAEDEAALRACVSIHMHKDENNEPFASYGVTYADSDKGSSGCVPEDVPSTQNAAWVYALTLALYKLNKYHKGIPATKNTIGVSGFYAPGLQKSLTRMAADKWKQPEGKPPIANLEMLQALHTALLESKLTLVAVPSAQKNDPYVRPVLYDYACKLTMDAVAEDDAPEETAA